MLASDCLFWAIVCPLMHMASVATMRVAKICVDFIDSVSFVYIKDLHIA